MRGARTRPRRQGGSVGRSDSRRRVSGPVDRNETALDDFDPGVRQHALDRVCATSTWPARRDIVNLHCHTFFSYNAYGYSPTHFAVLARRIGLEVAGIVDFDVLDGLDEFQAASTAVGLRAVASVESRVFVPELADTVVNSPGEPGIAYHLGVGLSHSTDDRFLELMRETSRQRIREMLLRVNEYLSPVELDFELDVLPLTPSGNVTERHLCQAFQQKAELLFPDRGDRDRFWQEKLGSPPADGPALQNLIRAKTLKQGGVGYAAPEAGAFPLMAEMNRFVLDGGGIPTLAWLDGTSDGERDGDRLLDIAQAAGVAAVNIIPDRNFEPGLRDEKLRNLNAMVASAEARGLPVVVGTEMNAPGNKFVDDFEAAELRPLVPAFLQGAHIVYAHSVLQRECGLGYLSDWAAASFSTIGSKNRFFEAAGRRLEPRFEVRAAAFTGATGPEEILAVLDRAGA